MEVAIPHSQPIPQQKQELLTLNQKRQLLIGGAITVGALAAYGIAALIFRNIKADKELSRTFNEHDPASYAGMFKTAFDNDGLWGTMVELVRRAMLEIPSKEVFSQVEKSYKNLTKGRSLLYDLSDELTATELAEMKAILQMKPAKLSKGETPPPMYDPNLWAQRLHSAITATWLNFIPNTDDDAIVKVLGEIPNKQAWLEVKRAYRQNYGYDLEDELDGELWMWGDLDWREYLTERGVLSGIPDELRTKIQAYKDKLKRTHWRTILAFKPSVAI